MRFLRVPHNVVRGTYYTGLFIVFSFIDVVPFDIAQGSQFFIEPYRHFGPIESKSGQWLLGILVFGNLLNNFRFFLHWVELLDTWNTDVLHLRDSFEGHLSRPPPLYQVVILWTVSEEERVSEF
jgi:hypothetical protein